MKVSKSKNNRGFTLVETIVAIYILLLVTVAGFTSAFVALSSSIFAKNQVTAFYLAQDVFDFIRNYRDVNIIDGENWLAGLDGCTDTDGCVIDTYLGAVSDDTSFSDLYLSGSVYTHARVDQPTNFSRFLTIQDEGDEALVTITVKWTQGKRASEFVAHSRIFNSLID